MRLVDDYLEQLRDEFQIPGIGVGVCVAGEIVYQQVKGISDIVMGCRLGMDSIFPMASISKVFSATAGMQLVEKNGLDLNEPILPYLPGFAPKDKRYAAITLQDILSHTSGIPDLTDYGWSNPQYDDDAALRYLQEVVPIPLVDTPGQGYQYSNRAYNILAALVRNLTGKTFEEYARLNIFTPLGMDSSTFLYGEVSGHRRVAPHTIGKNFESRARNIYPYSRIHASSTTLHSTIADMLKWMMACLREEGSGDGSLLKRERFGRLFHPHVQTETDAYMCLGWKMAIRDDQTIFTAMGGDPGFRTFMILAPEKSAGIIVVINSDVTAAEPIATNILRLLVEPGATVPLPHLHIKFGKWISEKGLAEAKKQYFAYAREFPYRFDFDASFLVSLGYILLHKSHLPDEAIDIFQTALEIDGSLWKAYNGIGEACFRLGKRDAGIHCYRRSLELCAGNPTAIAALEKEQK